MPPRTMSRIQQLEHYLLKVPSILAVILTGLMLEFFVTFPSVLAYHLDRLLNRR